MLDYLKRAFWIVIVRLAVCTGSSLMLTISVHVCVVEWGRKVV